MDKQAILDRVSLRDYIETLGVKIKGRNCSCPLHDDKTPSMVFRDTGLWYCFVCGVGGNLFNLVMLVENLTFRESLHYLNDKFSLNLTDKPYKKSDNQNYLEALDANYHLLKSALNQEFNENCERYYDIDQQVPYLRESKDYTFLLTYHDTQDEIEHKLRELENVRFKLRRASAQSVNR